MKRYAIVRSARDHSEAAAYLPANYRVLGDVIERIERWSPVAPGGKLNEDKLVFVIEGEDDAGWTLDGYVIPRYASGLIQAEEIDASHTAVIAAVRDREATHGDG